MEKIAKFTRRIIRKSRIVESGSYPLYRLISLSAIISGICQMVTRTWPQSFVEATSADWAGWAFSAIQFVGGLMVWCALYMHTDSEPVLAKVQLSLSLERMGCALMISAIGTYTYGVIEQNDSFPKTWATWALMLFGIYLIYRLVEIRRALKELRSE